MFQIYSYFICIQNFTGSRSNASQQVQAAGWPTGNTCSANIPEASNLSKNGSEFQMIVLHSSKNVKLFCVVDENPDLQQNGFWQLQMLLSPSDIAQAVKIQKSTLSWKLAFLATHSCRIISAHEKQSWNAGI